MLEGILGIVFQLYTLGLLFSLLNADLQSSPSDKELGSSIFRIHRLNRFGGLRDLEMLLIELGSTVQGVPK